MDRKMTMAAAALAALALGACAGKSGMMADSTGSTAPSTMDAKGECWGVNACKGQGWLSLNKSECAGKNGKFKAS
ncbi:MAG: hypothetical protein COV48_10060 [Elusimicrobia bacterium CG11_big_fil_rev_8_21_14_0_20_64_6]|nr:MAG: hypothetical protein COV48_10060 [Elusimicrobia bacterium CG11_big_fil_rev_8_21_14_0_20_64_6]